ncbi:tRNA dimethylallyltransferase, mitochondrial [Elasticomyces elasticus]|nr:tRNA dimethylallyltransferase, mitochondrial [Elasticomyces elasticus]KAK3653889.1 tRNA dimethylallyltransferase, mitochondrial [Elasticomyces elasticus]KAK4919315.1 tRNA dimethylallyltransferase, mitochondrial [Elasticomyces elasticus]KAK5748709.1 tRNA dimethylallyltransferase, mitochondrial [Elasticomyces elasticus]
MTRKPPREPLIAIIGATGTGKSQLAVELAKRYNGEVVNGDAMQLYAGLPIITNKITVEEQQGVPHHLLGCIGQEEPTWVVGTFVKKAVQIIGEIRARGRLPILVGGTHYYTQSLLFKEGLAETHAESGDEGAEKEAQSPDIAYPLLEQSTEVLLAELQRVDPVMAERWHPNDRRKIRRSLEIYLKTGRKASEVYAEQRQRKTGESANLDVKENHGGMRFPTLLFWVHAEQEILRERLHNRVDKMLDAGLLDEVRMLNAYADADAAAGRPVDDSRGIWVSIGYKQFKDYVYALQAGVIGEKELQRLKSQALGATKAATTQYAKRQLRWIQIKLFDSLPSWDKLYLLDASNVAAFDANVVEPAVSLTSAFLNAELMPEPSAMSQVAADMLQLKRGKETSEDWSKQHCEACDVTCVIEDQWRKHVGSKAHKKAVSKRRQRENEALTNANAVSPLKED